MTLPDILRRSWHNLGRAKVRVGLTAAALAIGAATMTLALAITQGAQDVIQRGFGDFKNNFVSVKGFAVENQSENGVQTSEEARDAEKKAYGQALGLEDVEKLKKMEGVVQVIPLSFYSFDGIEINGTRYKAPSTTPLTPLDDLNDIVAGKREALTGDTVILPERYAKQAGFSSPADLVGKKLTFVKEGRPAFFRMPAVPDTKVELTVVAVTRSSDAKELSSEYMYLSPETMSKLAEKDDSTNSQDAVSYNQILAMTNEAKTDSIRDALKSQGYEATSRTDTIGKALDAVNAIRAFLLVFAGIAIFTAIFGVINTQLMSILERTREIGIMKALGLSKSGVLLMFSFEAGWIGLVGSVVGVVIAIPVALLLAAVGGSNFSAPITIPNVLIVMLALVVIAMLSGLLPAYRASKLNPVDALRSE
jgi:putative ABC transport system permease protein